MCMPICCRVLSVCDTIQPLGLSSVFSLQPHNCLRPKLPYICQQITHFIVPPSSHLYSYKEFPQLQSQCNIFIYRQLRLTLRRWLFKKGNKFKCILFCLDPFSLGCGFNFKCVIFKCVILIIFLIIHNVINFRWMLQNIIVDQSKLVQVLAWWHQEASHYLDQYWLLSNL